MSLYMQQVFKSKVCETKSLAPGGCGCAQKVWQPITDQYRIFLRTNNALAQNGLKVLFRIGEGGMSAGGSRWVPRTE